MTMTSQTRRAAIATTAAALVAACAPAALAMAPGRADAELVRLGHEFAEAYATWLRANAAWRAADRKADAEYLAAHPLPSAGSTDEAWLAQFMRAYDASPAAPALAENDKWLDRCGALAEQISAIRPTTLAGLVAHAKVARFNGFAPAVLERKRADIDHDAMSVLAFLDLVEGFAT